MAVHLLSDKQLEPDNIKPNYRADALDSKLCYSRFSPAVMVLSFRQSPPYNQDLNKKMIHLLNLKELMHILTLYHASISSVYLTCTPLHQTRYLGVTSGGINGILKILNFNFHRMAPLLVEQFLLTMKAF